jgi:hypothetical protein
MLTGKIVFDTESGLYVSTGSREKWRSSRFNELLLMIGTNLSFRATAELLNRIRGQEEGGVIPTTVRNQLEREGQEIQSSIISVSEEALSSSEYDNWKNSPPKPLNSFDDEKYSFAPDKVAAAANELNIKSYNVNDYEAPEFTANVSVDDVSVKGQNPLRPMPVGLEKRKHIATTVIQIESQEGKYIINGDGLDVTSRILSGFLVKNNILNNLQIVFFSDGARQIHEKIEDMFSFTKYKIILDWYHVVKKFKEFSSMAFKGRDIRNEFLGKILPSLWFGNVDGAIRILETVDNSTVKNSTYIQQLISYLQRVRNYIPNYALRKKLGLRNSSNLVEKANDIAVARRQKKNGMSWSPKGSISLATISCIKANNSLKDWTHHRIIPFKLNPPLAMAA